MFDWMKDKIGRRQSPLQALAAGAYKDEEEKRALIDAVAESDKIRAEDLIPLLASEDATIHARATTLFLSRATPAAASALVEAILVADAGSRTFLARALHRLKPDVLRAALDANARDGQTERIVELAMELSAEVSEAWAERALKEGSPRARFDALRRLLAKRAPAEMQPTLIGALGDREARTRRLAIEALAKVEGEGVFEAMLDRTRDDDADVRQIAASYLQKYVAHAPLALRPAVLGRLLGTPGLESKFVRGLFAGPSAAGILVEILTFAKTLLGAQHASIIDTLATLGDDIGPHALRALENPDPEVRILAIALLERVGGAKTAGALVKLLGDGDAWVRVMACDGLARLKDPRTLGAVEKVLADAECRFAAIDAIGAIGGDSAFATLLGQLRDAREDVRLAAMSALTKLEDRRVDGYVEEMSKSDPSPSVRLRAVELLRARRGGVGGATTSHTQLSRPMEKLLAFARESGASDLHLTPNEPPFLRVDGVLSRVEMKPLPRAHVETLIDELLDPVRRPILQARGAVDFCYTIPGVGRYRVNVFRQLRGAAAAVRVIPNVAPSLASLRLPRSLEEIGTYHQGLVIVAGAAGSGKSTTLTALVDLLNDTRPTHILTLEDPVEFLHAPKKALVNQREIGRDTASYAAAMRGALREDPDVVVIGELRDKETVRLAMIAAETGHLVIATMQTTSAAATIDKIVESFPAAEHSQIRVQLAGSLKLVVAQTLVPRAHARGRVAAFEVLKATSPVRALIRDGKTFQLGNAMQVGRAHDMLTLDASLEELLAQGLVTLDVARSFAQKKDAFAKGAAPRVDVPPVNRPAPPPEATPPPAAPAPRAPATGPSTSRLSRPPKRPSRRMNAQTVHTPAAARPDASGAQTPPVQPARRRTPLPRGE